MPPVGAPHPAWIKFEHKYRNHSALKDEAIYALPETLINAILCQSDNFFSRAEERFERDLTKSSGGGFFLQQPFGYSPIQGSTLADPTNKQTSDAAKRWHNGQKNIKALLKKELAHQDRNEPQIARYFETQERLARQAEVRRWGYAGWLIGCPKYNSELRGFKEQWGAKIERMGAFPTLPVSVLGNHGANVPSMEREFFDAYTGFLQRWCLHTLATWDLPVPMLSGVERPAMYSAAQASESGLWLFVPWYLAKDQSLKLRELVKHERLAKGTDQLRDWFKRDGEWGHRRLSTMLKLHIHLNLSIGRRYSDRIGRNVAVLDRALGHFLSDSKEIKNNMSYKEENVAKIRKELNKRLRACFPNPIESTGQA